ncbi:AlpA family phage regulatory protein [Paraburkholderia phenoliruptrix]|uniref:helix-turn-helix transcriptional regulator n=1 Tax=Paraburkholderia phenoliruptrix TaxID=252970 RepID=UPI001C4F0B59|nr:AlpA family phage regulatory protein [Paraburkholderia phenoliruptrix]MBW9097519.1 AlpA family phage regulatory protein [Paraburkholderia phenoliruptrix]
MEAVDRAVKLHEVMRLVGLGRTKVYELTARGEFPPQAKLGARVAAWWLSDINQWLAARRAGGAA